MLFVLKSLLCTFESGPIETNPAETTLRSLFYCLFLQTLDFEAKSSYTLQVEVSNRYVDTRFLTTGPFSDVASVRLLVENVDEPPAFSSPASRMVVSEAAAVGTEVGSVSAQDPDATNSPVRYDGAERAIICS